MFKYKDKKIRAFSFVEVMISVFLVSIGLLAALSLLSSGLSELMSSRDQVTASLLAQEGTELVRNMRDANWTRGKSSFYSFPTYATGCVIDYKFSPFSNLCPATRSADGAQLRKNSDGFYELSATGTTSTRFFRRIDLSLTVPRIIDSIVVWNGKTSDVFSDVTNPTTFALIKSKCNAANKCAYAEDILSNWGE